MAVGDASAVISKYGLGTENGTLEDKLCRDVIYYIFLNFYLGFGNVCFYIWQ